MNDQREQAWQYFVLHANQRMSIFNFYISISLALIAGLGVLISIKAVPVLFIILGFLLIILSLVFWGLDRRTKEFIDIAENRILKLEKENNSIINLITSEHEISLKKCLIPWFRKNRNDSNDSKSEGLRIISYTFLFGSIYLVFMVLGIALIWLAFNGSLPIEINTIPK